MPVVVTKRCLDACVGVFGFGGREEAREWLEGVIAAEGVVTDRLPEEVVGRRSPSGYFLVAGRKFVLPLAEDRDGAGQWIATNCLGFPRKSTVDLTGLRGVDLLAEVTVLPHAVERFQQRGGGHRDPDRAHKELYAALAPTVRAVRKPPGWCRTRAADLYLVAGEHDEFCLPCRAGSGKRPYDVITCIHRAGDLFGKPLGAKVCEVAVEPDSKAARLVHRGLRKGGRLSWHRPAWVKVAKPAKWWLVFNNRTAAVVRWEPGSARPLVLTHVVDGRSLLVRLVDRVLGR
ncbi:hypothetical protein LV79_001016 [Actinokineospora globicatena]|nr:hypothetical protein [Actinokineospora globicatena]GLW77021.1 hypothetical protein Aglo01_15030 [Actinokineospora globicatena]GLW83855.1 hypothetical protein Aglo02_14950 [Actinokineospora globicatena]